MINSLMYVPATSKMLSKISEMAADAFIIDLEDSIPANEKDLAIETVIGYFERNINAEKKHIIRLNSNNYSIESNQLKRFESIGFMLPKMEEPEQYHEMKRLWEERFVIALVETPRGVINIDKIAACNWIDAIAFGAEDYTAAMNMENNSANLIYSKQKIVTYAKANNKLVFDTPSFEIRDEEKIKREADWAAAMGFDGKQAIHPAQIEIINRSFNAKDIDMLKKIVETYDSEKKAVNEINGKVYEKMHIERMRRIIRENGGN